MKRKILVALLALLVAVCSLSIFACGGGDEHNYQSTWTYGPDEHWHECADEGCNVVKDLADHTMVNNVCSVCGYEKHNYQSTWTYGPYQHWHECSDEDCNVIKDLADHTMVNGVCNVCGYQETPIA